MLIRKIALLASLCFLCQCGTETSGSNDWFQGLLDVSGWEAVDRVGLPGTNLILMTNEADQDAFNTLDDEDETAIAEFRAKIVTRAIDIRDEVTSILGSENSGAASFSATKLSELVVPDVLEVELGSVTSFPNGRNLRDDAFDQILGLSLNRGNALTGGSGVSDAVKNDNHFESEFPYLGQKQE